MTFSRARLKSLFGLYVAATGLCIGLPASFAQAQIESSAPASGPTSTTYFFVCSNDAEHVVQSTATEAWVFRPSGSLLLPAVDGPQRGIYSDGSFELRIEGDSAQFGPIGSQLTSCENDRRRAIWEQAKLEGVDFRAVGNEPDWVLEIFRQTRVVLVTDYGATRAELPLPPPTENRETRTTRWDAGGLQIEAIAHGCRDTVSREAFETEVIVTWNGRTLRGCGRALH